MSQALLDFAEPISGDSDDKEFIEGTISMVITCWNIGTVNYQEAQEMRDELDKVLIEDQDSFDSDEIKEFSLLSACSQPALSLLST